MLRIAGDADCQKVNCPKGKRGHPGVRAYGPRNDTVIFGWSFCTNLAVIESDPRNTASRRKNPTTFPGIILSEMPCPQEIILPLVQLMCIMKMTDYMA